MNAVLALQSLPQTDGPTQPLAVTTLGSLISVYSECSSGCQLA
ncbi:hypothetical protein [Streptomyces sp. LaBMicrA B280]